MFEVPPGTGTPGVPATRPRNGALPNSAGVASPLRRPAAWMCGCGGNGNSAGAGGRWGALGLWEVVVVVVSGALAVAPTPNLLLCSARRRRSAARIESGMNSSAVPGVRL